MSQREELVICGVVRTPFCFGNKLAEWRAEKLLAAVLAELPRRYGLAAGKVDLVVSGAVQQDTKAPNTARIASLIAGYPDTLNAYMVQSNCNSSLMALEAVMGSILLGDAEVGIASGVESMSNFGFRLEDRARSCANRAEVEQKIRAGAEGFLQDFGVVHCLEEGLKDSLHDIAMIEVAELMAQVYGVSREEQDGFARRQLERAVAAVEGKKLHRYLVPVGDFAEDNYPLNRKRMLRQPDSFAKAPPIFGADSEFITTARFAAKHGAAMAALGYTGAVTPTVTMYNSCIPGDGAGACLVTTLGKARELGLTPLLRIISWGTKGVNPIVMGIGPCDAVQEALAKPKTKRAEGLTVESLDILEIHEAFASQVLSVGKESGRKYGHPWPLERVNPYGGSLAFTHPLGATNTRLIADILSRFDEDPSARYGLATGCAGGGQGMAVVFERFS